jgi:hypothetical protein
MANILPILALAGGAYFLFKRDGEKKWTPTIPSAPIQLLTADCQMVTLNDDQKQEVARYINRRVPELVQKINQGTAANTVDRDAVPWGKVRLPSPLPPELQAYIRDMGDGSIQHDGLIYFPLDSTQPGEIATAIYQEFVPDGCLPKMALDKGGKSAMNYPTPAAECLLTLIQLTVVGTLVNMGAFAQVDATTMIAELVQRVANCAGIGLDLGLGPVGN